MEFDIPLVAGNRKSMDRQIRMRKARVPRRHASRIILLIIVIIVGSTLLGRIRLIAKRIIVVIVGAQGKRIRGSPKSSLESFTLAHLLLSPHGFNDARREGFRFQGILGRPTA